MKFDLEVEIQSWKRKLRQHRGFEDGDIEELEDHLRSSVQELVEKGESLPTAFNYIMERDYSELKQVSKVFLKERAPNKSPFALLKNFLKVGWRIIGRQPAYTLINIVGLTVGIASVCGIMVYVHNETTYDQHNEHVDEVFRVNNIFTRPDGSSTHYPLSPPGLAPAMRGGYSELARVARLRYAYTVLIKRDQDSFYEDRVFFAEPEYLDMFTVNWIHGSPEGALAEPNTVILTESMAEKYFGDENPVGKELEYNSELTLRVIGVIEDAPEKSHLLYDFLISFESYEPGPGGLEPLTSWRWVGFITYVQLMEGADVAGMESNILDLYLANRSPSASSTLTIKLQSLGDIYLQSGTLSNPMGGLFRTNSPKNLISLTIVAGLIIVIALFNYLNLTTALMSTRTKEVGVRKLLGSGRVRIGGQMVTETMLTMAVAGVLSTIILVLVASKGWIPSIDAPLWLLIAAGFLVVALLFALMTGIYVGGTLSAYQIGALLQGKLKTRTSKVSFKQVVLLTQYAISAGLIMVSLIVVRQVEFFSQKDLGYSTEGIIVTDFRGDDMVSRIPTIRQVLETNPSVTAVSFGPRMDGRTSGSPLRLTEWEEDNYIQTAYFGVDYDYDEIIGLEIVHGRYFSEEIAGDSTETLIINQTLAGMLDLEDPLGATVDFTNGTYTIVGVYKDFHYQSLHHEVGPMALKIGLAEPRNMLVKVEGQELGSMISGVESKWREIFPGGEVPFVYRMLNDQIADMYAKEKEFSSLLQIFTALAIFVAILGLYGISSITVLLRIKSICMRRVLGAETLQISKVVGQNILLIMLAATILATPAVFWIMDQWLANFAYRISLNAGYALITLAIVTLVVGLTLAWQLYRVMTVNPAKILKDE